MRTYSCYIRVYLVPTYPPGLKKPVFRATRPYLSEPADPRLVFTIPFFFFGVFIIEVSILKKTEPTLSKVKKTVALNTRFIFWPHARLEPSSPTSQPVHNRVYHIGIVCSTVFCVRQALFKYCVLCSSLFWPFIRLAEKQTQLRVCLFFVKPVKQILLHAQAFIIENRRIIWCFMCVFFNGQ